MVKKAAPKPEEAPDDVKDEFEPKEDVTFDSGIENTEWAVQKQNDQSDDQGE